VPTGIRFAPVPEAVNCKAEAMLSFNKTPSTVTPDADVSSEIVSVLRPLSKVLTPVIV
jgi:hypothetical protein